MIDLGATLDARTTAVLMLLDLDGFKAYNDTFGHPAGDALLARIAEKLGGAVASEGEVYRIGGDEFCVLAGVGPARSDAFAAATAMSLEEQGPGFKITAAYGTVALPEEAAGVADALRIVDGRMYDEKDGRRASAGRQSRDVLLRVLYERDARLQGHLSGLVELVRAVGVGVGLSDDELADVTLAAELHEVGKLAIPDSILLQARAAERRGVELRAPPPADRRADPVLRARAGQGVEARALDPGAHGRHGLSGPARWARTSRSARASSAPARRSSP